MSNYNAGAPRHSSLSRIPTQEIREARKPIAEAPQFRGPSDGFFEGPTRSHGSHRHSGLSHPCEGMGGKGDATGTDALKSKIEELAQMLQELLAKLGQANGQSPNSTDDTTGTGQVDQAPQSEPSTPPDTTTGGS
jgi:ribosomal protein L29